MASLCAALVELARQPELRQQLGHRGQAHVAQHFGPERMVADYRRVCLEES